MTWTVKEIERDWLLGSMNALSLEPEAIVAAFNRAERLLDRSWIEELRISRKSPTLVDSVLNTVAPALHVVSMGQRLAALDGVADPGRLIEKIRHRDSSAIAELTAIYIVRRKPEVQVELEPPVGSRFADFRVREKDGPWTNVEVTFPSRSQATKQVQAVLELVASVADGIKKEFALEVLLRRDPDKAELSRIIEAITAVCNQQESSREEMPGDLGLLLVNNAAAVRGDDRDGTHPRVVRTRAIVGPPHRQITVSMACADQRAEAFLDSEASQLSKDTPGLIMIDTQHVLGNISDWEPRLESQLELGLHRQVSGICLFWGAFSLASRELHAHTRLILNRRAEVSLPNWLDNILVDGIIPILQQAELSI